jgi:hypothetical protein
MTAEYPDDPEDTDDDVPPDGDEGPLPGLDGGDDDAEPDPGQK